ncbi:CLOCK-interacting pacemaker [Pseudonaja textilis]|uniref:CLOCK-interacting pacemaker n=1 Tax=Pseudonaja textilis TaxID=8673 RepID=UPI000EA90928|nr:CLOCK-interacting pacemaker [Pseudonaja textilis]
MPSNDPSTPPSWPAEDKKRPLARPGPTWGGHVGQPEKMERPPRHGAPKPSCPGSEGEKDSGFSDRSSECLSALEQTDTGDPGSPRLPPGPDKWQEAKGGLTPLYFIQNVILEQTLGVSPTAPFLAWSNQRPLESAYSSAAHLLLFQEPTASLKPMVPSQKPSAKEIRFPTLGAYPRIAPHPGRQPEEAPSPAAEPIRHKQLYVGEAWAPPEAPTGKDSSVEKSPEGLPTSLQTAALVCPQAPARPPLPRAGRRAAVKGARRPGEHSLVRQRRLHNTVEILRRSGLLGITLRTKELLRQNSRVQRELAQLREEAQLLCQAVRNSDWQVWARLQGTTGHSAAPCLPSKGAGIETHLGQQQNLAPQPPGLDTPLPMALP